MLSENPCIWSPRKCANIFIGKITGPKRECVFFHFDSCYQIILCRDFILYFHQHYIKVPGDFPGSLPVQWVQALSLVRELRFHMLWGQKTNKQTKQKRYCNKFNKDFKNHAHQKTLKKKKKSACFPTAWGSDIKLFALRQSGEKYYLIFCAYLFLLL